jgi:hypothetical protein
MNFVVPKPWVSETQDATDTEIKATYIEPTRSKVILEFGKQRRTYGQKLTLGDRDAQDIPISIGPSHDPQYMYQIKKRVNDMGLQASNTKVEKPTQTFWNKKVNKAVETTDEKNHLEIEDETELVQFLQRATGLMEDALTSNETINIFADDFNLDANDDEFRQGGAELSIIQELKSFEYEECQHKLISCIQFMPKTGTNTHNIVATSFMENLNFDERIEVCGRSYKNEILFWDYEDMHLFVPVLVLTSPLEILTFEFKPNDPNVLIAGAINGQILLWNLAGKLVKKDSTAKKQARKGKDDRGEAQTIPPVIMSTLQEPFNTMPNVPTDIYSRKLVNSHRNQVTSLKFLPPQVELDRKNPLNLVHKPEDGIFILKLKFYAAGDYYMFLTTSSDGQVLFWDAKFDNKDKKSQAANPDKPDYVKNSFGQ